MIRIFVLDDLPIVKLGINRALEEIHDIEVVGEASSFDEAIQMSKDENWDVLWLGESFSDRRSWNRVKQLRLQQPAVRTLVVGEHVEAPVVLDILKMGAAGYITKSNHVDVYPCAIRKIAKGESYVSEDLVSSLVEAMNSSGGDKKSPYELLTDREQEVFILITNGMRVTDIANELHISVKTVSTHRKNILDKLKIKTTADMVRYAMKFGLVA